MSRVETPATRWYREYNMHMVCHTSENMTASAATVAASRSDDEKEDATEAASPVGVTEIWWCRASYELQARP